MSEGGGREIEVESGCLFFSSRRRHTRLVRDWSSDVCSSDLQAVYWGFFVAAFGTLGEINFWPLMWMSYPTALSEQSFFLQNIWFMVANTFAMAVIYSLSFMAAETLTPCVLELGGHAPVLIFDDVDIDQTAKTLAIFKFRNAGQVCVSPSRFFVHAKIVDEFTEKFVKYTSELVVGDGIDVSTNVGPLAHERRVNDVGDLVEDAKNKGARCLLGGHKLNRAGYFYAPTVLTDVPANAELMQTEIFGPVAVLSTFDDIDDVLKRANDVPYGLASYLFTQNQSTIDYVRPRLDVGLVSINITTPILENVPFGGVKESGYGYEGGVIGLQSFQHFKLIHRG